MKFHNTRPVGKLRKRRENVIQREISQILVIQWWVKRKNTEVNGAST